MPYIKRNNEDQIVSDLKKKMVFLAGPRQCGKTSTARKILKELTGSHSRYLNWDSSSYRESIMKEEFPAGSGLIVLDEIHKYSRWRQVVKGLYDTRKEEVSVLVTGSGKLDHYSHGGDSLQGRYFFHRMYPLSMDEFPASKKDLLKTFLKLGAFPENLTAGSETAAKRWSRDYRRRLIEEDVNSLENVRDLGLLELLSLRLAETVASPLSINSLREDIQVSHRAVSSWLDILEAVYYHFRIYPFGSPKIRAVKKEAKLYLFDWLPIANPGIRFENLCAFHLKKQVDSIVDREARELELRFFRDTDGREIDFIVTENKKPILAVECKLRRETPLKGMLYFKNKFPETKLVAIYADQAREYTDKHGIAHLWAESFFRDSKLLKYLLGMPSESESPAARRRPPARPARARDGRHPADDR